MSKKQVVQSGVSAKQSDHPRPAFFYKNSSVFTCLEVLLLVSFPLLSVLIVASGLNTNVEDNAILGVFISIVTGFIVSFVFFYMNIAQEKERIDYYSLYLMSKLYLYLKFFNKDMQKDIKRVRDFLEKTKRTTTEGDTLISTLETMYINTHIYNFKIYMESFLFSLQTILPNSNFILSLFFSNIKQDFKKLDRIKINDSCAINFILIRYMDFEKIINEIVSDIDDFPLNFSDSEMVRAKFELNITWLEKSYSNN